MVRKGELMPFSKWHGTGNDFILLDAREGRWAKWERKTISMLCDRHFGIGSDGLICVRDTDHPEADYEMEFFNPDGSQSFCGNGSRTAYAFWCELTRDNAGATFVAIDGVHDAHWKGEAVSIGMRNAKPPEIMEKEIQLWDTGSPHLIIPVNEPKEVDIIASAHEHRYNARFKENGVNVNYISWKNDQLTIRTYERGVEAETLSCGTGVTAAALSAIHRGWVTSSVSVVTPGGRLNVFAVKAADGSFTDIRLDGPVRKVFEGVVDLAKIMKGHVA